MADIMHASNSTSHNSIKESTKGASSGSSTSFPTKLYKILQGSDETCGLFWSSDGKHVYFVPKTFNAKESKTHFQGTPYNSFSRRMYRHGFDRLMVNDNSGNRGNNHYHHPVGVHIFRHKYFQRGCEHLMKNITVDNKRLYCRAIRDNGRAKKSPKQLVPSTVSVSRSDNMQSGPSPYHEGSLRHLPFQQPLQHRIAAPAPNSNTIGSTARVAAMAPLSLPCLRTGGTSVPVEASLLSTSELLPSPRGLTVASFKDSYSNFCLGSMQPRFSSIPSAYSVSEALFQARIEGERRKLMLASFQQRNHNSQLLSMLASSSQVNIKLEQAAEDRWRRELAASREQDLVYLSQVAAQLAEREGRRKPNNY